MAQHLNNISMSINKLAIDLECVKSRQVAAPSSFSSSRTLESFDNSSALGDLTKSVADVKKYAETAKSELSREINVLETMIIRKCEITMNKMINDKINLALESQKSSIKEFVLSEIEKLKTDETKIDDSEFEVTMGSAQPKKARGKK